MGNEFENDFLKDNKIKIDKKVIAWALKFAFDMNPFLFVVWVLFYLISAVLPTLFISYISDLVDVIQSNVKLGNGMKSIIGVLITLVAVMLIHGLLRELPHIAWVRLSNIYAVGMQREMGKHMRKVPVRYFDDPKTVKLMEMAQDKERSFGEFISCFFTFVGELFSIITLMILAVNTSYILLIAMLIFLLAVLPIGIRNAKRNYQTWLDGSENHIFSQYYLDMVMRKNPKDVRLFQMEDYIMSNWRKRKRPEIEAWVKSEAKGELDWALMRMVDSVCQLVLLFIGLFLLKNGNMTLGGMTIFITVFSRTGDICMDIGYSIMNIYENCCDLKFKKMMFEKDYSSHNISDDNDDYTPTEDANNPVVFEMKNVSFSYNENVHAIKDLSLCIRKGETIALVGENGAGKSTLVKLLLGLYEPDKGAMFFKGTNYQDMDTTKLIEHIGVVFQDFVHFGLMARENVAFGDISKVNDDEAIMDAVNKGGADSVINKLPKGIDTYLGRWYSKDGGNMSGGEWQRIAVSRAHISNREILIMDEPAAALDPIAEMEQFKQIKNSLKERTSVLVSHRIGFARLADKIVVLNDGRMIEYGTHEELMKLKGNYYEMFSNQADWYKKEV